MPWWCQLLWDRFGPPWYEEIEDPAAFLAAIRQQFAGQVDELTDELAGDDRPGEGYLAKVGRLTAARHQAEEIIRHEYGPLIQTTRTTATSRPLPGNGRQSSGVPSSAAILEAGLVEFQGAGVLGDDAGLVVGEAVLLDRR